eukprot:5677711-Alexandrium_andersonii.AAC.1
MNIPAAESTSTAYAEQWHTRGTTRRGGSRAAWGEQHDPRRTPASALALSTCGQADSCLACSETPRRPRYQASLSIH